MASQAANRWQQECTQALHNAVLAGRGGKAAWEDFRSRVPAERERIVIADGLFAGKSLAGFDLSRCYFIRNDFSSANLSSADFSQSIFRSCDAAGANIEGADFRDVDMRGDGLNLNGVRFDDETRFEVQPQNLPDELEKGLMDLAAQARQQRRWRMRKSYSPLVRIVYWLTRHGFSISRLLGVALLVVLGFALIFRLGGTPLNEAILRSMAYFISLDSAYESGLLLFFGLVEATIGMILFAVLTAILVSILFEDK